MIFVMGELMGKECVKPARLKKAVEWGREYQKKL